MRTSGDHRLLKVASLSPLGEQRHAALRSCTLYTILRVSFLKVLFAQHAEVMECENTPALADSFSLASWWVYPCLPAESRLGLLRPVAHCIPSLPLPTYSLGFLLKYTLTCLENTGLTYPSLFT